MILENKVVVITGSEGQLGQAFVRECQQQGAKVVRADIALAPTPPPDGFALDITQPDSVEALLQEVFARYGRLDGWVNNAYPRTPDYGRVAADAVAYDSWRQNIDMHLNGYFLCAQRVLNRMAQQGSGSLVNLSSIYGSVGPDFTVYEGTSIINPVEYSAIKGGIVNLTRYHAAFYGPSGVRVNAVSPGGIWNHQPQPFVAAYNAKVPLKRMGHPEDIAPAVAFLLSDGARYITGHNLMVDGGWTAI